MTITAHFEDDTICIVTDESEIVPALRLTAPFTRAVFFQRPELTAYFMERIRSGNLKARYDEDVLFHRADYLRNPFAERYAAFRAIDMQGSWKQIHVRAKEFAIDMRPETAQVIFEDMRYTRALKNNVHETLFKEKAPGRMDFNVVARGAAGCTPKMHPDIAAFNAHVSYLTPVQWLKGIPAEEIWDLIVREKLEKSSLEYKSDIRETQLGDVVFIKGLGLFPDDRDTRQARLETFPHRSSEQIPEHGQLAVANF